MSLCATSLLLKHAKDITVFNVKTAKRLLNLQAIKES